MALVLYRCGVVPSRAQPILRPSGTDLGLLSACGAEYGRCRCGYPTRVYGGRSRGCPEGHRSTRQRSGLARRTSEIKVREDMMDAEHPVMAAQAARSAMGRGDLDEQIAQQDATIHVIERRLVVASAPRSRLSLSALHNELSITQELAAARDERGAMLYDRQFATAAKG
jgi:hypothetical protein